MKIILYQNVKTLSQGYIFRIICLYKGEVELMTEKGLESCNLNELVRL